MATSESLSLTETINGKRYYAIGENRYPSVTTVLGSMTDKSGLDEWRANVGEAEADRISTFSANRGTIMHQMIEFYLGCEFTTNRERLLYAQKKIIEFSNEEGFTNEELEVGRRLFYSFYNNGLFNRISKVISIEETLYSHQMGGYAGRVDNIYENTFSHLLILDFKTSRKQKKKEWIENYFLQTTAYAMMVNELFGLRVHYICVIIAVENGELQTFLKSPNEYKEKVHEIFTNFSF
jgi:genome maintenance exonuclease 1